MDGLILACGEDTARQATRSFPDPASVVALPTRPGKRDVDPLLEHDAARHLVVLGTDGDMAAVVSRLLRRDRLAATRVGFVPARPNSAFARRWRLPRNRARAIALAREGVAGAVPLIRDDAGGVLLGRGVVRPVRAVVYCDDQLALRGDARGLEVLPGSSHAPGLEVRITHAGLLRRSTRYISRAVALGCDPRAPARPVCDGVPRDRPAVHWTWYRHTEDLRLIRHRSY